MIRDWSIFPLPLRRIVIAIRTKFTYMSIRDEIEAQKLKGALRVFPSQVHWGAESRVLLLTQRMQTSMDNANQSQDRDVITRYQSLAADFTFFVDGGYINSKFMKWLDPHKHEIWEIRSVRPRPSLRVFGRFAEPDVFVATHMVERSPLGGKFSMNWCLEMVTCEQEWKRIFTYAPFSAEVYENYITTNARRTVKV